MRVPPLVIDVAGPDALPPSPVALDEARSGRYAIEHRELAAGTATLVSLRESLLSGGRLSACEVVFERPLKIHALTEDGDVWMSDCPQELAQIERAVVEAKPRGSVLVGGLGLGCLASRVAREDGVERVTVVEVSPDVAALASNPALFDVVIGDVAEYVRTGPEHDCYMLDTWRGTDEGTWWREVMPLRRAIVNRHGESPTVWCWAEDQMVGQITRSAMNQAGRCWHYRHLAPPVTVTDARRLVGAVGLPEWEQQFGAAADAVAAEYNRTNEQRGGE